MDEGAIVRRFPWGLVVVALLGLSGCLPASRGWVREQLAPVQGQVAEVRDRVAAVEEQFGRLDPKVDRILTHIEQQQSIVSYQPPAGTGFSLPLPSASPMPGNAPVGANLDLTITGEAPPLPGGPTPPDCLLKTLKGEPCSGRTTPPRPAPVKALKSSSPGRAAPADCLLKTLKGEPC
jgi:hypothetical protein